MPRDRPSRDQDAEDYIDGGGSAPEEDDDSQEVKTFSTRFPEQLVERIDEAINDQMVSESRNQWLMRAAVEKLERDA